MGETPKYWAVVLRAAQETGRVVIAHSWRDLAWKVFAAAALLATAYVFTQITPAQDDFVFTDQITLLILIVSEAVFLTFGVFLIQLLFVAPFQLWGAEWKRAEAAETRCAVLSGGGPVRDRTNTFRAAAFMIFGEWDRSLEELTEMDHVMFVASKLKEMVQDASDGHLEICVKWQRHSGSHVNPGKEYWGNHHLDWGVASEGSLMAKANSGAHRLTEAFEPLVRESDIERLYGPRK